MRKAWLLKPLKDSEPVVQATFRGHDWKLSWGLRLRLAAGFLYLKPPTRWR